jgi:hypothetical protein
VINRTYFKPLESHRCEFEFGKALRILSFEEAIQLAYGTSVVLLRCLCLPDLIHRGLPPPVKLGIHHDLYSVIATLYLTKENK